MSKYGDRFPKSPPLDYARLRRKCLEAHPLVCSPAVLQEGFGLWVRCGCGKRFEYLRDQVQCPECLRLFQPNDAEDELGSVAYGEEEEGGAADIGVAQSEQELKDDR